MACRSAPRRSRPGGGSSRIRWPWAAACSAIPSRSTTTECTETLSNLKLLASQQNFTNIGTDIPWSTIPAVNLGSGTSVVIPANSSITYNFVTADDSPAATSI